MQEILIHQEFVWGELCGFIPGIYVNEEGIAVDLCIRVPNEKVRAFLDKWGERLLENTDEEEQEQITGENPLHMDFNVKLFVNGQELENVFGCGASYSKVIVEEYERRYQKEFRKDCLELQLMQEYGCEDTVSWYFERHMCRWECRPEELECVEIELIAGCKEYFGETLEIGVEDVGRTYEIQSPVDGSIYQLHICEAEQKEINQEIFAMHRKGHLYGREKHVQEMIEYPNHYLTISYRISSASVLEAEKQLSYEQFRLMDRSRGDKARRHKQYQDSAVNVIVGEVDGPTSIFIAGKKKDMEQQLAITSMYFEPITRAEWSPVFLQKEREDMRLLVVLSKSEEE